MRAIKIFLRQPFRRSAAWMVFLAAAYALRGRNPGLQAIEGVLPTVGWLLGGQSFARDLGTLPSLAAKLAAAAIAGGTIVAMLLLRPYLALAPNEALTLCAALLSLEAWIASLLVRPAAPPEPAPAARLPARLRNDED